MNNERNGRDSNSMTIQSFAEHTGLPASTLRYYEKEGLLTPHIRADKAKWIEELSLNHWQPLSTLLYDGWLLRFADGYTKRANSISPILYTTHDTVEKIERCESVYTDNGLPTLFKMTPFNHPANLDSILEERGYANVDPTSVQTVQLDRIAEPKLNTVTIEERASAEWLDLFSRLNQIDPRHRATMERMLGNIRTKTGFVTFYHEGRSVACGFGVIERGYIGLYDIVTDREYRGCGFGEQMILNLLKWGRAHGAEHSYLAVVANNAPAVRLYAKLGYTEVYRYWYRVKNG